MSRHSLAALLLAGLLAAPAAGHAADAQVERGKYLATMGGCSDCHTPGTFFGKPDMGRFLGGSDVGFAMPGAGVFVGRNLTPDNDTGLGKWTPEQIVTALTTGMRPDGRVLSPIMPWQSFAHLTSYDAMAIARYLKSLKPVKNAVPGPFGPQQVPSVFVMAVLPGAAYACLPAPDGKGTNVPDCKK